MAEIVIRGIEEVCRALDGVPDRIVKQAYGKALAAAAVPIVEALRARTPVNTGKLASHIKTDIALEAKGKGADMQVGFGNEGYVARFIEFGHRLVGHKPDNKELGEVSPHPFMRVATAESADKAIQAFAESMLETLQGEI